MMLLALLPVVFAEPVAPEVTPPTDQAFQFDQNVRFDAPAADVLGVGQSVEVVAPVADNAFLAGESVFVTAPVVGDVFGMASRLTIDAPVTGDVFAMGSTVEITARGSVGGNVYTGAGEVLVRGPVVGDLNSGAGKIELAAPIGGTARFSTENVQVREGASIGEDLIYQSRDRDPRLEGLTTGEVRWTEASDDVEIDLEIDLDDEEEAESGFLWNLTWWSGMTFWGYLTHLAVGALTLLIGGKAAASVGREVLQRPGAALGVGFLTTLGLPALSLALLVTIVPFPLGILGFTAWFVALYLGQIFAAQALGDLVLRRFQPDALGSPLISLAVGLVPLTFFASLPWLGTPVWFFATLLGIGALALRLRNRA